MTLERKIVLLVLVPLGFALIPAGILLSRSQKAVREMERLQLLAALVEKMTVVEKCLDLEQVVWWQFTPDHESDSPQKKAAARAEEEGARVKTDAALASFDEAALHVDPQ